MNIKGIIFMVAFAASAVAANWLTTEYGFVPVGFGLLVTAGTYAAGAALVLRDGIHDTLGIAWVFVAIAIGTALSVALADPAIALASGVAFALSEILDAAVYTPLRKRRWRSAVVSSSIVGAIVDTAIFLAIAFGIAAVTVNTMAGQLVGKVLWIAVPYAIVGGWLRSRREVVA